MAEPNYDDFIKEQVRRLKVLKAGDVAHSKMYDDEIARLTAPYHPPVKTAADLAQAGAIKEEIAKTKIEGPVDLDKAREEREKKTQERLDKFKNKGKEEGKGEVAAKSFRDQLDAFPKAKLSVLAELAELPAEEVKKHKTKPELVEYLAQNLKVEDIKLIQ